MSVPERLLKKRIKDLWGKTDFLSTLFESLTSYAIVAADFDGNVLAFNEGASLIFGHRPKDVIGKKSVDTFYNRRFIANGDFDKTIGGLMEAGRCSLEERMVRSDGSEFPAHVTCTLTKDKQGEVVGFIEIIEDLTDRERAEAELRQYHDRLEQMVQERTAQLSKEIDDRERAEETVKTHLLNQGLINELLSISLYDRPIDDIMGDALDSVLSAAWLGFAPSGAVFLVDREPGVLTLKSQRNLAPETQKSHACISIARFFPQTEKPKTPIFCERCEDGPHEELHSCYRVPLTSNEHLIGALLLFAPQGAKGSLSTEGFLQTVASTLAGLIERHQINLALKRSEEYWRLLIENSADIIAILDANATVRYITPSAERALGHAQSDLIGKRVTDLLEPDEAERALRLISSAAASGGGAPTEIRFRRPDGQTRTIEAIASNMVDNPAVHGIVVNGRDITERKLAEIELEANRHELIRQNKVTTDFLNILETTSGSLNFDEALNKLLPLVSALTGSDYCLTFYVDIKKLEMTPTRQYGLSAENQARFMSFKEDFSKPNQRQGFAHTETMFITNIDIAAGHSRLQQFLRTLKARSLLVVPIVYESQTVAILAGVYLQPKTWRKRDEEIIGRLRGHLEAFYTSFRHTTDLLNKTITLTRNLEMIEAMTGIDRAILSSTSKAQVVFGSIQRLGKVIAGDVIEILEFDAAADTFRLVARSEGGETTFGPRGSFSKADFKSWTNLQFGSPAFMANLEKEPVFEAYERRFIDQGFKSLLIVPLMSRGDLLGALAIANQQPAAFAPEHLGMAQRLGNQIAVALSNTGLIKQLQDVLVGTVNSLVAALDAKSPWTKGHSQRVSDYSVKAGEALGLNEGQLYNLKLAALFHDIGKIGTYDVVLDKKEKLTDAEFAMIKKHPGKTYTILSPIPGLEEISVIAKHHHEKYNGQGYPDGLIGENIPLLSRIICLADSYDAMTSDRPYRKALSRDEALAEIERCAGVQFDPEIAHVFVDATAKKVRSAGEGEGKKAA